jgi:NADH-quinone oxidoreductase subunit L
MEGFLNLAWFVPVPPFLAFVVIILFLNRNKTVSSLTAITGAVLSLLIAWPIAFTVFTTPHFGEHPVYGALYTIPTGLSDIVIGYQVDPANAIMLFMAAFLILMIFIYSSGYMSFPAHLDPQMYPVSYAQHKDPRYSRFMAYVSLFATGMFGLIVSNSLLTFFIFWEVMGLCSYLLIGFWYEKPSAQAASIKAFMTTRIGDAIMFIGMMVLYVYSVPSSLEFKNILTYGNLEHLAETIVRVPIIGADLPIITVIAFLIFFGTVGKSAQFPLHVWLPDAMEGPTPVSAMIHAATMVSAGVFLLVRMFPLYLVAGEVSPGIMTFVAYTGAFTALFASTIAVAQWDIKRVLAYSTISQLGYMVAAIGVGAYVPALFHLITHAFFKALLFLGSGSVIHGVEHGFHHAHEHGDDHGHHHPQIEKRSDGDLDLNDPQDMRNMGGLLSRMPITGWTFIIGGLALSGFPILTAGFWSKDEILAYSWGLNYRAVFWVLAIAAFLTAFYTMRQIGLTFLGQARSEGAEHAPESVWQMTVPLMLIAPFAIALGWIGIPKTFPLIGGVIPNYIEEWEEPLMEHYGVHVSHPDAAWIPLLVGLTVALGGLAVGWLVYREGIKKHQIDPLRKWLGPVWVLFHNKYYVDELYQATVVPFALGTSRFLALFDAKWVIDPIVNFIGTLGVWLAGVAAAFDRLVVDGFVNGLGSVSDWFGGVLRRTQDGNVQVYLLVVAVSITIWLLLEAMPLILTLV